MAFIFTGSPSSFLRKRSCRWSSATACPMICDPEEDYLVGSSPKKQRTEQMEVCLSWNPSQQDPSPTQSKVTNTNEQNWKFPTQGTHNDDDNTKTQQLKTNNYGIQLRGRLATLKHTVSKLSMAPNKVWPDLNLLTAPVHDAFSLATSIVRGREKVELTGILKEDLLKTAKIATKLIVPNGKREMSTYSGLRKVRRLLNDCTRIAAKLHEDVSCRGDSLYKSRGSTCTATSSTTNVSTHWKPSLKCTFFLKPATLTGFKGMTAEYAQSLATALANQDQPLKNNTVSKKPTNSVNYGATCRDLNRALQSVPVKPRNIVKSHSKEPVTDTMSCTPVCYEIAEPVVSGDEKQQLLLTAIKIRNRLTRVQSDSNKLSSSVETQSLDMMKQYLDGVKQLVENIIRKPVSAKMTAMLKTNLQNTLTLVNKLHNTCNKTDQVGVRVLSRLRCILEMCGRMATNFHIQVKESLKCFTKHSRSTLQDQLRQELAPSSSTQSITQLVQTEPMESDFRVIPPTIKSTHWKPSMDCKFFLKPPTLVYKGMTEANLESLAIALAADHAKLDSNNSADVDMKESKDINFDDACKDLSDALQLTPSQSKQPNKKESTRLPLTLEEKRQASKRLANKLSLCLIAVQRELSRLSPGAVRSSLDDLKIAVDNASSLATAVCSSVTTEMTSLLLEDLQDAYITAKKQRVPANKKEQSRTSRGLSRAKRLLEVGVRMANALHNQAVVFSRKKPASSGLSPKLSSAVNCSSANASSIQNSNIIHPTTTTNCNASFTFRYPNVISSASEELLSQSQNLASFSFSSPNNKLHVVVRPLPKLNCYGTGIMRKTHIEIGKPESDVKCQSDGYHSGSPLTGLHCQVKRNKVVSFSTELVSFAEEKNSRAERLLICHQSDHSRSYGNCFKTMNSRKKTLKPILKHTRRLKIPSKSNAIVKQKVPSQVYIQRSSGLVIDQTLH